MHVPARALRRIDDSARVIAPKSHRRDMNASHAAALHPVLPVPLCDQAMVQRTFRALLRRHSLPAETGRTESAIALLHRPSEPGDLLDSGTRRIEVTRDVYLHEASLVRAHRYGCFGASVRM